MPTKKAVPGHTIIKLCLLLMPIVALADENLTLKDVMQGLNTDMRDATYGIIMEDYELVAKSALAIAEHPTPDPAVLKKIVGHLGAEMPKFKGFDTQVHDAALELQKAAIENDRDALLDRHDQILRGCVGCHQQFRESVTSLFDN